MQIVFPLSSRRLNSVFLLVASSDAPNVSLSLHADAVSVVEYVTSSFASMQELSLEPFVSLSLSLPLSLSVSVSSSIALPPLIEFNIALGDTTEIIDDTRLLVASNTEYFLFATDDNTGDEAEVKDCTDVEVVLGACPSNERDKGDESLVLSG